MAHSGFELSKLADYNCSLPTCSIVNLTGCTHNGTDVSSSDTIPYHIGRPKLLTPLTNGFIRHRDSTFRKGFFECTEAQTQSMREPDGVADAF